jgi:DNA-binding transcriptional regulator GbsR (MarR family)
MNSKEIVLKTLVDSPKPLKGGEISEMTGLDKKEVDKVIKVLKTEDLIESPIRCFYSVKK